MSWDIAIFIISTIRKIAEVLSSKLDTISTKIDNIPGGGDNSWGTF